MNISKIVKNKDTFTVIVTFFFILAIVGYFIYFTYKELLQASSDREMYRLLGITNTLSSDFDGDELMELGLYYPEIDQIQTNNESDIYYKYHKILKEAYVRNELNSPIHIYTYEETTGKFELLITSNKKPNYKHEYKEPPENMLDVYYHGGVVEPFKNSTGYWISACSPIHNSIGEVVAMLQGDSHYELVLEEARVTAIKNSAVSSIILILLGIGLVRFVKTNLKRDELEKTNMKLKTTQDQLVQSEKMASLGSLIAGITHEINTPLGVIHGSISNVQEKISKIKADFPEYSQRTNDQLNASFRKIISFSNANSNTLSTREERKMKRKLKIKFQEYEITGFEDDMADFIKLGLQDKIDEIQEDLKQPGAREMFANAVDFGIVEIGMDNMDMAVKKMNKIIFALKNYSYHNTEEEKGETSIIKGIETVLVLYYNQLKIGVEVKKEILNEDVLVFAVADELDQVWTNIINNAIYAMKGEGTLTLKHYREDDNVVVQITDSGKGIPEDIQKKIFDPFFTTKPRGEGTGLGLDICKGIIEKHGGTIKVASRPGQTTFTISLPIVKG